MIRTFAAAAILLATALPATAFETRATAAYVYDQTTGTVLLNKNADDPLPPASMSKLMTLYVAFEAIKRGQLRMTDELVVSAHANSFGGSTLFLKTGERVTVEELMRGIIVLSGNDACVVIAEALSPDGTEGGFARMMTRRAQDMGLTNSTFINSSGWPAAGHRMSMRDLGELATRLIEDFPEFYPMFAETEFLFDATESANRYNRNPLLKLGIGADGLKTGHTQEAGYGLTGSAKQGDRRIVFVLSGLDTTAIRAQEAEAIVNWAFRQFAERTLASEGQRITTAPVWEGAEPVVGLVPAEDISVLLPVLASKEVAAEVVFKGPIQAPIVAGTPLAELVLQPEGLPEQRFSLVAEADVAHGGFLARISTAAMSLFDQISSDAASESGT
ncbi:D-alanyl-D-alanine carboxypeptidase family protein [Tateyamaria pelophila]|uniref:D-alanyl-D-alanine carboxypeptidase family protein n=1 Tax=Tateyamaria pelophila TaxID=328415 RepID=UPI001CBB723A|nr:D-alanyl-D-alanine carboxypeptidase family protein [Tateyamaria pelophila]